MNFQRKGGVTATVEVRCPSGTVYTFQDTAVNATTGPTLDVTASADIAYCQGNQYLQAAGGGVSVTPDVPALPVYMQGTTLVQKNPTGNGYSEIGVTATPDASASTKGKLALSGDLYGVPSGPFVRSSYHLPVNVDMQIGNAPAVQAGITFPARTTGLSIGSGMDAAALAALKTATGNNALTAADVVKDAPNFADAKTDPTYKFATAFTYNGGINSTTQQVGTFFTGRSDSNVEGGASGSWGQIFYRFQGRYLVRIMRDLSSTTQYLTLFVSKDGGPFKVQRDLNDSQYGQEILSPVGDGLYYLQVIDLGAVADWRIWEETESATFGGYYHLATETVSAPDWRIPIFLLFGDSFSIPSQGQYRGTRGFPSMLSRNLGAAIHLSGCGGTGFRAKGGSFDGNGQPIQGNLLNYVERIPYDVDRYFNDDVQPDAILGLGSQNERSFGFTGTPALDTNIDAWCTGIRGRFPTKPMFVTSLMHTRTETWNADYVTINAQLKAWTDNNPRAGVKVVRSLLEDGITYGTGYQGATNGSGPSDTLTWTDSSHPSPGPTGGQGAIATQIATYVRNLNPVVNRPGRTGRTSGSPVDASRITTGTISVARLPADEIAKYRLIRTAKATLNGALTAAKRLAAGDSGAAPVAVGSAGSGNAAFYLDPSRYAIAGKTTRFLALAYALVGDTSLGSTISAYLLEVGSPSGGAAGAPITVAAVGNVSGSTAGSWPLSTSTPNTANTSQTPATSTASPAPFTIASAKWVAFCVENFAPLSGANSAAEVIFELYVSNA